MNLHKMERKRDIFMKFVTSGRSQMLQEASVRDLFRFHKHTSEISQQTKHKDLGFFISYWCHKCRKKQIAFTYEQGATPQASVPWLIHS